jgi:hypothetical protein
MALNNIFLSVALGEEGIFRIPGSTNKIRELKQRYDKGM